MTVKQLENPRTAIALHGGLKDRSHVKAILKHYQLQRRSCNVLEGCQQLNGKIRQFKSLLSGES